MQDAAHLWIFFSDKYKEMVLGVDDIIQVDFWDFGGQLIFYTTHPTYMSDRCLYFLVFDCSIGLQGEVNDPDVDTGMHTYKTAMGKEIRKKYRHCRIIENKEINVNSTLPVHLASNLIVFAVIVCR